MGRMLEPNVKSKYAYFLEWTGMGNGTLTWLRRSGYAQAQ
jgi:hypothetical protein